MARSIKPANDEDAINVLLAMAHLRSARSLLRKAGAESAARKVRRAIASADGARRHVTNRIVRTQS